MENIELALLSGTSSVKSQSREGNSRSYKTSEGGFAGVLAGQEERTEVDAKNNPVAQVNQDGKQTAMVESEKRDENGGQSQVGKDDSEDESAEIDVDSLFHGLAFKEVPSEEAVIGEIFLAEELSPVVEDVPQIVVEIPQVVAVENEGPDRGNSDSRSLFAGLLENRGDLSPQTVLSENMADPPPQGELLGGIEGRNDDSQNLFVTEPVVGGEHAEVVEENFRSETEGPALAGNGSLSGEEQLLLGSEGETEAVNGSGNFTSTDSVGNLDAAVGLVKNENEIKNSDDHKLANDLTEKSESLSHKGD